MDLVNAQNTSRLSFHGAAHEKCFGFEILRCVMRHQNSINSERVFTQSIPNTGDSLNTSRAKTSRTMSFLRYKKSTVAMAYILGFYFIFYMPFIVTLIVKRFFGYTGHTKAAYICTSTLVFLNSSANPIVYCWRMKDIRNAVKKTLRKLRRLTTRKDDASGSAWPSSFFHRNVNLNVYGHSETPMSK